MQPDAVWHSRCGGKRSKRLLQRNTTGPARIGAVPDVPRLFAARCRPFSSGAGVMHRELTALSLRAQTLSSEPLGSDRYERVPLSFVGAGRCRQAAARAAKAFASPCSATLSDSGATRLRVAIFHARAFANRREGCADLSKSCRTAGDHPLRGFAAARVVVRRYGQRLRDDVMIRSGDTIPS